MARPLRGKLWVRAAGRPSCCVCNNILCCHSFRKESRYRLSQKSLEVAKWRHHLICIIYNLHLVIMDAAAEKKQHETDNIYLFWYRKITKSGSQHNYVRIPS